MKKLLLASLIASNLSILTLLGPSAIAGPTHELLHAFVLGPIHPQSTLIQASDGNFYGTTFDGGASDFGTVFRMTPAGALTTLVEFTGNGAINKGSGPDALVQGSDGNFYGTTSKGGASGYGTVFKMTPGGVLTTLVEFTGNGATNKGSHPEAVLLHGSDGNFYGTTYDGGAGDFGTVFKMTSAGLLTTLVEFTGDGATNKGSQPQAALVQGSDGNFYGTTSEGGASGDGTVFRMTPAGALTTLVEFTGDGATNKGESPNGLVRGSDGNFYGTTSAGGASGYGTVFKMTPAGVLTTLVEFDLDAEPSSGEAPSTLVQGNDGNFYGTTVDYFDTVFRVTPAGALTTLFAFAQDGTTSTGDEPNELVQGSDGNLYGSTGNGGPSGGGTIFRLRFGPTPVTLAATGINSSGATLHGTLNPNGITSAASFEYGTSPTLATFATVSAGTTTGGNSPEAVTAVLSELSPGVAYYYRVVGTNAENATPQRGAILSFTTVGGSDADIDGLLDSWELTYWGTTVGHAASDDFDRDGVPELLEEAFGLNPTVPDAASVPQVVNDAGYLAITLTKHPGVTYEVQSAGTLLNGQPDSFSAATTTVLINNGTTLKVRDNILIGTAPARFLRVKVTASP